MAKGAADDGAWPGQVNALGGFIRAQRQMANLSLREMASMTRVSNAYLSQVERGLHQPSLKVLHSIADALHLNTDQLLTQAGWGGARAEAAERGSVDPGPRPCTVEEAVRAETRLTDEQKAAIIGVYRSFLSS
jgi:transcriptional regulator with XRE-family HTH domain